MGNPIVSVIVPIYNGEEFLAEALTSIFAQEVRSLDVIAVDDGSTDTSAQIAQSFDAVRYVYQPHQGIAAARNRGVQLAQGEFVAFLDQDDLWMPHKLRVQLDFLRQHPDIDLVLARERGFVIPGLPTPEWLPAEALTARETTVPGAWLVRRRLFERVGDFQPRFRIACELDWFLRARDMGAQFAVLPETLLLKRIHTMNYSADTRVGMGEMMAILKVSIERRRAQKNVEAEV